MARPYHSFTRSLSIGKRGEADILKLWPGLIKLAGRRSDFVTEDGETLELKTDMHDHDVTANFFIELMSDLNRGKIGGPKQALEHGSKLWVYYFPSHGVAYVFDTVKLVRWLDKHANSYKLCYIENRDWTTVGIKVPRAELAELYTVRLLRGGNNA